jgi:hypothetical protein
VTVNAGGTLGGAGTVAGPVTVNPNGTIRGGAPGTTGTLTVTGDLTTVAGTGGQGAGRLVVTVDPTTASRVAVGGRVVFSNPPSNDPYVIQIDGPGLTQGTSYTRTIVSAAGGFFDNATPLPPGTPFTQGTDFVLTSPNFPAFSNVSLAVGPTGQDLVLTFTPVPEPGHVLLVCAGAAGLVLRRRRGT